jgi:4a-hydroxytetrahydrobiopterin dehydratase
MKATCYTAYMTEWKEDGGALSKTFQFEDFKAALAFVNKVGEVAERLQHHPDIVLNYSKVTISSTTHDAGSVVTHKDTELGEAIDAI